MFFKLISRVFLLCLFFQTLNAGVPKDISFFNDKPRGIAKDFYIYRYLKDNPNSKKDIDKLLEFTSRMSMKLFHTFARRSDDKGFKKVSKCLKMKLNDLIKSDTECLNIGFTPYSATKLDKDALKDIAPKLLYKGNINPVHVMLSDNPFKSLIRTNNEQFFQTFNKVGSTYRQKEFDKLLPQSKVKELEKDKEFNKSIKYIVTDLKLKTIQNSLLNVDANTSSLTHHGDFFLGLNALKLNHKTKAMEFLKKSYEKAYYQMDRDKVLFWQYLVTKDNKYKDAIKTSFDFNIYTILAGKKDNHILGAKAYKRQSSFNEQDPFEWSKVLRQIKNKNKIELEDMSKQYLYASTIPIYAFLMEKASGYKNHYFPLPYFKYLKHYDKKRIALILAISRQESRFVPSAISSSYALGMMQFMPFLAKAIAKQKKYQNFDLDDMFNPETAYMFANIHLNYLNKYLYNPLFIAYAYNGGIGFTKRLLKSGLFQKGEFEPYLSMELVSYDESRKYGKKVLANYIEYMKILQQDISAKTLVDNLLVPNKSDNFRN